MKLFIAGCVFLAYFVHALVARQKGCSFSVHGQSERNAPILLQKDMSLVVPNNGRVELGSWEKITVACPDPKNYLIGFQSNMTQAQCVQGSILRMGNHDVNFTHFLGDFHCKKIVRGTVSKTTKKCGGNKGHIYKIGYPISPGLFIKVIEVCYDASAGQTLYTKHSLHGQDIKHASKSSYRPGFSPEGSAVSVSIAYKQTFQKATFSKLLKSALLAEEYINKKSYLVRGHLSPDADFLFAATQFTTHYYINVSPQWQAINAANWKKIEYLVRKFADGVKKSFMVITGTYGVLTVPDAKGQDVEIFLVSGRKLPVAKFVWKIVYSTQSKDAIVFVNLNNPFIGGLETKDILCKDICKEFGWGAASWSDFGRGFVYCCDYKQFAAAVETAPKLQVLGILRGPN
ncbi:hypothetical protein Zmor_000806 [Zophobas morio]|uniref:DNA/RNA non-specific endonuclease/pyrophosphatase/phosphodiesterase domain-containing protein n=2 Tax=Zophobas morio TaxID=2755281 RepID=A0AA38IZY9_9CUCU|nr:hypothetical protein Zmor_000806 [Zophobas morio]